MKRLSGKVALITGAARGQGRAHAVRLATEGADIIAFDSCGAFKSTNYDPSTPADLEETARLVEAQGRRVVWRQLDARDFSAVKDLVVEGTRELGRLDTVVVNHGICHYGYTWDVTEENWDEVISVNLTSVWKVLKAVAPYLMGQGQGGSIVVTSSVAGVRGQPFLAPYVASKHALVGLTKTLANELGQHRIRVNTVLPGGVKTPMAGFDWNGEKGESNPFAGELNKPEIAATLGPIFMNALAEKWMEPEDVANTVAFLASDESKFITGAEFPVDCGSTAR
ncbi:mycofactocin-coupled SDR family oxidoreductase [Rhodococcus wratislaviensis]|uniref:Putative oxidoreductase n=1 Tax=Rhodococcus wratislaviensis NBRC 100605 TaxID=1219028 RepID=X0Q9A8_RHOWR|nr:mycofactocin-coupled SDR family oxidoreductase [Rhodococcus wratislaviensis]GAF47481.1 putative oxidoreductase [Rhodococcus wratislaviensis NBRC 100605]